MADLPTEAQLLSAFLFPPAPLPLALPLSDFTRLFPPEVRSSPEIPKLYRELQHQVSLGIDDVKRNITTEVARGEEIKLQIAKSRRKAGQTLARDGELAMDIEMHGPRDDENLTAVHSERSLVKEMQVACEDIEQEIKDLEQEAAETLEGLHNTVGDLSDLRYGKFAKPPGSTEEFGQEVLQGIRRLQEVCEDARISGSNG